MFRGNNYMVRIIEFFWCIINENIFATYGEICEGKKICQLTCLI